MRHARFAVAPLLFILLGCAVQGPAYQQAEAPPAKSVVYLYRPYNFWWQTGLLAVHCGDDSVVLRFGGYHKFTLDPGPIKCSANNGIRSATVEIDAQAGETYFVRESVVPDSLIGYRLLTLKSAEEAQAEIEQCREQLNR